MVPAQVWTTDWGQVATGRFGKAGEPVAFPRALRSQAGGAPSTIRRAPPRPCRAGSAHTRRPSRKPPHRLGPRCPACSTARPRLLRRRCGHCGRGALVVGAGPWARIAPGVDHGEGTPPKARARRPLDGPGAHRVGDLRGPSPLRGRTDRGRQVVADIAHRHARAYKLMIIESRPPGPALSPWATRRGVNEPARHHGRPPVSKGLTSEVDGLGRSPASSCWDAPTEPTRPSRNSR